MTPEFAIQIVREMLITTVWLSAPILATAFVVGIVVSLLQIVTSIQDAAFGTVPRLTALLVAFMFSLPWMLKHLTAYTTLLFGNLSRYAR